MEFRYIDGWSFFGKDFSWDPVIRTLYRLGLANAEVREAFLGSLRNMGLDELAEKIEGVWSGEIASAGKASLAMTTLMEFTTSLNPFMASYEVSREVINIVWKHYGVEEPTMGLKQAIGAEKFDEVYKNILNQIEGVFGVKVDDIEVVKKLPGRIRGFKSDKFMAFDIDINGRLKIFIGQRVLEKYSRKGRKGKLDNFLMISLIHESLESLGLTHRQIEQAGFSEKNVIANVKSIDIDNLIKDAIALAERNGIKVVQGKIDTRRGGMLRDTIQEKLVIEVGKKIRVGRGGAKEMLENIVPEVQRDLIKAFELKGKITSEYDNLLGALHLLGMADIFRGNTLARRNVKVGNIKWDAETAARAAWYPSSDIQRNWIPDGACP